jgi:glycosyltransferase involved in cell wall biosynthesis
MLRKPTVLINALHTTTGGGLIYLQGILPELVRDERMQWQLLTSAATQAKLIIPAGVVVRVAPKLGFGVSHLWEQLWLPVLARVWSCKVVLSNANYGPLLAPRASIILHTTPRAAAAWEGAFWKVYWALLKALTQACVARAPLFFSVAKHIVADYAAAQTMQNLRLAPPAIAHENIPEAVVRDPNLVLAVGDFYPQKNYPLLLRAFAKLREAVPKARLMIVGRPVQQTVRDDVMTLARELNITSGLTLVPGLPHDQLLKAMAQAAVYVSSSSAEAFNMPVLEAMACGTPVVVLETPFQREVAGADPQAAAVFVQANEGGDVPAALAIALLGVLANPPIAETLARRGRARAAQFTWPNTARTIANGLAEILKLG